MELKVSVLGAGSWGTTVAALLTRNAPTLLWARNGDVVDEINREHRNSRYLPTRRCRRSCARRRISARPCATRTCS